MLPIVRIHFYRSKRCEWLIEDLYVYRVLVISIVAILVFLSVNAGQGYAGGIDSALFSIIGTRLLLHLREDSCRFFEPSESDCVDSSLGPAPIEFAPTDYELGYDYEFGAFPITGIPAGRIGGMDFLKRVHPPRPRLIVRRSSGGDVSTISERTERSEETAMEEGGGEGGGGGGCGGCGIRLGVMRSSSIGESITTLVSQAQSMYSHSIQSLTVYRRS